MDLKGTRTEANLRSAFAGETQARSKYDYFAKAAEKEGFQQIAAIFRETADNEEAHAFLWFSQLGALSNTAQNLVNAQSGEHFEWAEMYEDFARVAEEEGFTDIANKFRQVGAVEKAHEERFLRLLHTVEMQKVFEKTDEIMWQCRNCGHVEFGKKAPDHCPVCGYPKSYFQQKPENYGRKNSGTKRTGVRAC